MVAVLRGNHFFADEWSPYCAGIIFSLTNDRRAVCCLIAKGFTFVRLSGAPERPSPFDCSLSVVVFHLYP
jgi:hypothetical protein